MLIFCLFVGCFVCLFVSLLRIGRFRCVVLLLIILLQFWKTLRNWDELCGPQVPASPRLQRTVEHGAPRRPRLRLQSPPADGDIGG